MASKQQGRGMPGGYGYGSTSGEPPPPGYSQQPSRRTADVYYDYGTIYEFSFPNQSLLMMM